MGKFSIQDLQDLQDIQKQLPDGDARKSAIQQAINEAITPQGNVMAPQPVMKTQPLSAPEALAAAYDNYNPVYGAAWNQVRLGAIKNLGNHLNTLGNMGLNTVMNGGNLQAGVTQTLLDKTPDPYTINNGLQKFGGGLETAGEFLAPGAVEEKFLQGAGIAPKAVTTMGKVGTATAKATYGAGTAAGLTTMQDRNVDNIPMSVALGGGLPLALEGGGAMAKKAGGWLLDNSMEFTKPVLAQAKDGNYGGLSNYVIQNGTFDRAALGGKAGIRSYADQQAGKIGEAIDNKMANFRPGTTPFNLIPIWNQAEQQARTWAAMNPTGDLVEQARGLRDVVGQTRLPNPVFPDEWLTVNRNPYVGGEAMRDVRSGLGLSKGWNTNPFFSPPAVGLRDSMYGMVNDQLHNMVPGLQNLDEAYAHIAPFGKSVDNKNSLWPVILTAEMGRGAEGEGAEGIKGMAKGLATYLAARSSPVAYYGGRLGYLTGQNAFNLGMGAASLNSSFNQGQQPPLATDQPQYGPF